jgi:hypothetical protein
MGRRVLCRMDDACPGRVYLFDPETEEYLGKAEHPGLLGWTAEQVRGIAVAAARKQKAEEAAMRKAWKKTAARADVADIGNEILAAAAFRAKAAPAPAHERVVYTTPALEQAALAATPFAPPLRHDAHICALREKAAALVKPVEKPWLPENPVTRYRLCKEILEGGEFTEEQRAWARSYARSNAYAATARGDAVCGKMAVNQ